MTAKSIKLHNKGERPFDLVGGTLQPNQVGSFPADYAEHLKSKYPHELFDLEQNAKDFGEGAAVFEAPVVTVKETAYEKSRREAKEKAKADQEKQLADSAKTAAKAEKAAAPDGSAVATGATEKNQQAAEKAAAAAPATGSTPAAKAANAAQ